MRGPPINEFLLSAQLSDYAACVWNEDCGKLHDDMVIRNPINQTPASFPLGLFTDTSSRISHNAALPTWLLLASVFSAGWSANGNFNNARSCWSGLSNTRPLLPLLRLECSPLPEWRGSGRRTKRCWLKTGWQGGAGKNLQKAEGGKDGWRQEVEWELAIVSKGVPRKCKFSSWAESTVVGFID